jgi:hypothetical protein
MSLPSPKEVLKSIAKSADMIVDALTAPAKQLAAQLNLPLPPEPPRATEVIESLPELPVPAPAFAPTTAKEVKEVYKEEEVVKIKPEEKEEKEVLKVKIV